MTQNIGEIVNSLASNTIYQEMLKMQHLVSESPLHMHFRRMEQQKKAFLQATQPLHALESILLQSSVMESFQKNMSTVFCMSDAFKEVQSSLSISNQFAKSAAHLQILSSMRLQAEQMTKVSKTISDSMKSMSVLMGNATMAWSSEMKRVLEQSTLQNNFRMIASDAFSSKLSSSIAGQFRLPAIDQAAATLLAGIWGKSGLAQQLNTLGIDFERVCREVEQRKPIDLGPEPSSDEECSKIRMVSEWLGQPTVSGPMTLIALLLSIFSICLIYFPSLLPQDDGQQQARFDELEKHLMKQFQPLLEQAMSKVTQQNPLLEFVVKERVTFVRRSPENGSVSIAEIFPNQCVTMLDKKGKWIKIEYYDWLHQEFHTGWALKKYFARVPTGAKAAGGKGDFHE
jgi:hypothetical protein